MSHKFIVSSIVATATLTAFAIGQTDVSASRHTVRKALTGYSAYRVTKHATSKKKSVTPNSTSLKELADNAVQPVMSQYGKDYTYTGGAYVSSKDNGLNAKVNSAPYVSLSGTDHLGRVQEANAWLNKSSRQTVSRDKTGNANTINPVGYKQAKVGNTYVYNRGHLIGYALAGKVKSFDASEANPKNIMTETAWANQSNSSSKRGQLYYETLVRKALDGKKGTSVRYRVKPLYNANELVPRAILMQAKSSNNTLNFNVIVPNVQPRTNIDYATGNVR